MSRWCKVSPLVNVILTVMFVLLCLIFVIPFILAVVVSFSSESSIEKNGYSFFPTEWSIAAYEMIFRNSSIWRSLFNSIVVTSVGTGVSLILILTMGYALSRRNFRFKKLYTAIVVIPMFFSGGLAASYVVNTQLFHLKDNILALILPCVCSSWYIFIAKRYFSQAIPTSIVEAAKLDRASELCIFRKIVLPMSGPLIATIGIFQAFAYWNSWYYAMIYISNDRSDLYPLQYMLVKIQDSMEANMRLQENLGGTVSINVPTDGFRMALLVIIVVPIILLYPIAQKYVREGMTEGSVKE